MDTSGVSAERAETHLPAWMLAEVLQECASVEATRMDASECLTAEAMAPARIGAREVSAKCAEAVECARSERQVDLVPFPHSHFL